MPKHDARFSWLHLEAVVIGALMLLSAASMVKGCLG
jgi:hypothetical protein